MLTLIQFIRKLYQQLKSDLTPTQLAVGAFLGVLAGLTPFGLHLILLFTIALLFNCSMAAFLFVMAVLKPVGLALGGTMFGLGVGLLDGGGFYASIIQALSEAPVLAYLGFDRYAVAGGYAFAFPVAVMVGLMTRIGVANYRERLAPKIADAAWYESMMKKRAFRFFHWVIAGKDKEFTEPKKRFLLFRPFRAYMVAFVPLLYVGITVGAGLYAQAAMQGLATDGVGRALGVKCSFGKVDYSFFGQRLAFENFQLPDPSDPKEDMVRVGGFEADLGFVSLLSKRLHIEKLAVRDVGAHLARNSDGKLNVTEVPGAQPKDPAEKAAWEEWLQWLTSKGKDVDWSEVWTKYQEYRTRKKSEVVKGEGKKKPVPAYDADLRWEPERREPIVRVDLIEVKNLALRVSDRSGKGAGLPPITSVEAAGAEISTMPGWNGQPLTLVGAGLLADGTSGKLSFTVSYLPSKSDVEFKVDGVPLTDWRPMYEKRLPVTVEAGHASVATKAGVREGAMDGAVNLRIDRLKIAAKPGEKILGLDPEMSGVAVQGINAYGERLPVVVGASVTGTVDDPSIRARLPFLDIARKGLEMLGKKELQKYIDRLGGEVDALKKAGAEKLVPLEGEFKNVQDQVGKAFQSGDIKGVEDAVKKAQTDIKQIDVKKEAEGVKEGIKGALDLFKKKDKK